MPTFYNFTQDGLSYSFDDVFVPADLFRAGNLWTWGTDLSTGRLGNASTTFASTPITTFGGGVNWKQVNVGMNLNARHGAGIKSDGTLWLWGEETFGTLGNSIAAGDTSTPVTTFTGGTNWKQVCASYRYTVAIKTDGTLWTWGNGINGKLGNAVTTNASTPVTTFAGGTNWKQISTGTSFVTAIKTDGTLWAWGNALDGKLGDNNKQINKSTPVTTFAGGTNWEDVEIDLYTLSAGADHIAAIKTDGTLWTWGNGNFGRLGNAVTTGNISTPITTFAGGSNWKQISSATRHTAAIKTDGTLWTWGNGQFGKLGNAVTNDTSTPVTTRFGGTNWKQVSAGTIHTAAIKTDGTLWTWGDNDLGKLGIGDILIFATFISTPVTTFAGGTNWADTATTEPEDLYTLSSGYNHTAAIKTDGTLWTWGYGAYGNLGNAQITNISTPVTTFAGGTNWKQISSGSAHMAAIKTDGTLWTWGRGSNGRLGNARTTLNNSTPSTTFTGGTNWKQVSAAWRYIVAIKTDGTLWGWGDGDQGRLGNAVTTGSISTPVTTFAGGTNWKQVGGGYSHTVAIKTDGTLWTWGNASNGSLGNAATTNVSTPVTTFTGGTDWKQISSGDYHTAAIKTDGTLWIWGGGTYGKLGTNDTTQRSTPVTTFAGGVDWKQVSTGGSHTAAIKTDGTLWTWGVGTLGRLGNADTTNKSTPITTFAGGTNWKQVSAAGSHTLALRDDGVNKELFIWGNGNNGRLGGGAEPTIGSVTLISTPVTTFAGGTNWKQVSAGYDFTAAIKTDGTLWTWGNGINGKLGNAVTTNASTPVTTFTGGTNWKQVDVGDRHITAIKTDGTLWVWGNGGYGRLGNGAITARSTPVTTFAGGTNWKQISAGNQHTSAIKTDGTLWNWGRGYSGELGNAAPTAFSDGISTPITTFAGGTDWKQVSAGGDSLGNYTVALRDDGVNKELFTWGYANDGQLGNGAITARSTPVTTFAGGTNWEDIESELYTISSGDEHIVAIKTDGTLWTWGRANAGKLGNGVTTGNISTPVTTFAGGTDWKQVSGGDIATSTIKTNGTLWLWGGGAFGALGNALTTGNISTPITTFAGGTNWKQVSFSGNIGAVAIKTDGTLWAWGFGGSGRLGNASTIDKYTPVTTFTGGTNWKYVDAGGVSATAIKTDGTLWLWGAGSSGRLGNAVITGSISTPITTFAGGTNWKQVSMSGSGIGVAAIKTDGTLWTWGDGNLGRLGNARTLDVSTPITTFTGGTNWKQVSTGGYHTAAIKTDGTLWTWGYNGNGQLGNNDLITTSTPVTTFTGGTNWKQVSCGQYFTVALRDDGLNKELFVWGNGLYGQLGAGETIREKSTPITTFAGGTNWKQVSAGTNHTAAIKTDGTLWFWGEGNNGQLGNAVTTNVSTPVTTFTGGTNWKQVSSGDSNTAAIKIDGTLWTWGDNGSGRLGIANVSGADRSTPVTTFTGGTNWKQVSFGHDAIAAIKTDGTLWVWGNSGRLQLGNFSSVNTNSTPITTFAGGTNWKEVCMGSWAAALTYDDPVL